MALNTSLTTCGKRRFGYDEVSHLMKMEHNLTRLISRAIAGAGAMPSSHDDKPIEPRTVLDDGGPHHRRAHRNRTLKAAKAVLTDWTTIDCTIRDMSESGARLVFGDAFTLPKDFRLLIVMTNVIRPVRLLWQRGLTVGVAFTGPEEPVHAHQKPGETHG